MLPSDCSLEDFEMPIADRSVERGAERAKPSTACEQASGDPTPEACDPLSRPFMLIIPKPSSIESSPEDDSLEIPESERDDLALVRTLAEAEEASPYPGCHFKI